MLIHPVVIVEVRRNIGPLELGSLCLIERPAFFALAAVDFRGTFQIFAFANVEAGQMAGGGKAGPDHAVAVDIHAARIVAGLRNFEDLRLAGFRRIVAASSGPTSRGRGSPRLPTPNRQPGWESLRTNCS